MVLLEPEPNHNTEELLFTYLTITYFKVAGIFCQRVCNLSNSCFLQFKSSSSRRNYYKSVFNFSSFQNFSRFLYCLGV
jgi:hypothetical protein